jgi:uncharacterized DUF497 family protein
MTSFQWDEKKRLKVLTERGIDFLDAAIALQEEDVVILPSPRQDEQRYVGLAEIEGKIWAIIHLWRGETLRIITVRRAKPAEICLFHER